MDETASTRAAVRAYFERVEARDWDAFGDLLAETVLYEMPQSRERVRGKQRYLRFNQEYPGDWHLEIRRIVADGRQAAAWIDSRIGADHQDACIWFDLDDDGLIAKVTDYWPEDYEPPPGREHLVERW